MSKKHHVIIGPGLDGRTNNIKFITHHWISTYNLFPEVCHIFWKDDEGIQPKLHKIIQLVDQLAKSNDSISLIGCSASGSLMLNAFVERKNVIHKVINLDGFLRPGYRIGYRSFEKRSAKSIAFRESVYRFEKLETKLTPDDKKKILTVRPLYDELVPPETVVIDGAKNIQIPTVEHVFSIALSLVMYDPVIRFLLS
jgi:hypothetical protein